MIAELPWFRLYGDAVDDEKLRLLAFEDRWHFVAILCCKCKGLLDAGDDRVMLRRKMAVKLGLAARELDAMADRLGELGLIDPETFQPVAWADRQFQSDVSTERVRRYRERQAMKRGCNVSETVQETETDTETDPEHKADATPPGPQAGDKPVKGKSTRAKAQEQLPDPPSWLDREAWDGFVAMRVKIKHPMTHRAAVLVLRELERFRADRLDANEALDQSTRNNWRDVYPPKDKAPQQMTPSRPAHGHGESRQLAGMRRLQSLKGPPQ